MLVFFLSSLVYLEKKWILSYKCFLVLALLLVCLAPQANLLASPNLMPA